MRDKLFDQLPDDQKFDELTAENLEYIKDNLDEDENIGTSNEGSGSFGNERTKPMQISVRLINSIMRNFR